MLELVLEGPGKNALSRKLLGELLERLRAAPEAPVLLRGAGGVLSAGVDLKEITSLDASEMRGFLDLLDAVVEAIYLRPGPTVALVDGHAIAGGCVLAMACDWRVAKADPTIRIGLSEVAVGVRFPPLTWAMVKARLPQAEAVVLGAGLHAPAEALRLGLVDEVVEDAEAAARARLGAFAGYDPAVYASTKAAIRGGALDIDPARREAFLAEVLPLWTSETLREKLRARLKK